jgi:MarR family transcriptional regulator, lower aerobic nicotinate degradation pathway regulator
MSTSQRVLDSIRRIVRLLREGSRISEKSVGLSGAQLFVLQKLDPKEPLSLTELAARTLTHQSSVSVVVSRLVERGLVLRRPAAGDARRLELLPTRRGLLLRERAPGAAQDRLIAALSAMTAREQRALADNLEALVRALGVDERAAPMLFADEPPAPPRRRPPKKRGNKRA